MNNKKGTSIFLLLMLGMVCFVLGLALAKPTKDVVSESMLQLNCSTDYLTNTTITHQNRAYCTAMDMFNPLVVGVIFGLAGILLGGIALR